MYVDFKDLLNRSGFQMSLQQVRVHKCLNISDLTSFINLSDVSTCFIFFQIQLFFSVRTSKFAVAFSLKLERK
jgi:hypothetical protein